MIRFRSVLPAVVAAGLLAGTGGSAEAQVFTLPFQAAPHETSLGIYLSDFDDLALEAIGRARTGNFTFGFRGGLIDAGDDVALTVGGEVKSPIALSGSPVDFSWTAAGQAIVGEFDALGLQGGIIVGKTFIPEGSELRVSPYVHPRLAFTDSDPGDGSLDLLADLGVDLQFTRSLSLRFGVNLGEGADFGIGLAWR